MGFLCQSSERPRLRQAGTRQADRGDGVDDSANAGWLCHRRYLPATARPNRHRSLGQHPSDRLIRHSQLLPQVVQRLPISVQDNRLINLRPRHDRPSLARTSNVLGDRRAMKAVDLG